MENKSTKELVSILALTFIFGLGAFILANLFDESVSEVTEKRHEISELTRVSVDQNTRAEEYEAVDNYTQVLNESLPSVEDIADILTQLEVIAEATNLEILMQLEEGVVGEGAIEFTDEKERETFLKSLDIQEFNPTTESMPDQSQTPTTNVALQLAQEQPVAETDFNINYLEISVNLKGTYDNMRTFIEAMKNSQYVFTIKEIRINKVEEGTIDTNLKVRAFIFEE